MCCLSAGDWDTPGEGNVGVWGLLHSDSFLSLPFEGQSPVPHPKYAASSQALTPSPLLPAGKV